MCGCLGYDLFQGDDWQEIYYNSTINFDDVISEYDDDIKREVVAAVCSSTIHDGDHLTVSLFGCVCAHACVFSLPQQYSRLCLALRRDLSCFFLAPPTDTMYSDRRYCM